MTTCEYCDAPATVAISTFTDPEPHWCCNEHASVPAERQAEELEARRREREGGGE